MELDNLKDLWRDLSQKNIDPNSDEQIVQILQKRSRSPIDKMKRNLLFELIAVIILYSPTMWYFLSAFRGRYREIALFLLLAGIIFIFYYYRKKRLLGQMQCIDCEVRFNLQRQLTTLEKYVQFYFVSGTVAAPVAYFVSGFIVLLKYPGENITSVFTQSEEYIVFVVIGLVITIGSYFFNQWYVKKLYGQHIKRLKQLLLQTEENEYL